MSLLELAGVRKTFGSTAALSSVELCAESGSVHAVLGENGAGKSTLMKILSGAEQPDAGEIRLGGAAFRPATPEAARAAGVAIVYQEPLFCPDLTVLENIVLGREPARFGVVSRGRAARDAQLALERAGAPSSFGLETLVRELPPAERQLVAIARALVDPGCRVLILDEPTSALTLADTQRLFRIVRELRAAGVCVLYISHFLEEVEQIADDYTVLRDGRSVASGHIGEATRGELVQLMAGREVKELFPRSTRSAGEQVLEVRELSGKRLPIRASLQLRRGQVLGIAGLVGSGRTELLRAIFGLDARASGDVLVHGTSTPAKPAAMIAARVGFVSEDRKGEGLAASLSIAENITLAGNAALGPWRLALPSFSREVARRWISRLGIRCRGPEQLAGALSGGNQQKVALARLLHQDMEVLLLDEPTRGIDVGSRADVYRLIDELAKQGKAVLLVSSYLPELIGICDQIAVMVRGQLGTVRPASSTTEHSLLLEATG